MHYAHAVALFGSIPEEELEDRLREAMDRHYYENEEGNEGQWDWFVVGGRWGNSWVLRPNGVDGPLETESSTFGMRDPRKGDSVWAAQDEPYDRRHTDCARLSQLEPESMAMPYSWLDLGGVWRTQWLGPEGSGSQDTSTWEVDTEVWTKEWLAHLQDCPPETWMILVDIHN